MGLLQKHGIYVSFFVCCLPLAAQQSSSGIDLGALDKSVSPCANFFQYACGTWIRNNPVPGDQARWTRFNALAVRNEEIEHKILEAAAKPGPDRSPQQQKIGDYYAACMDEAAIEQRGVDPLNPILARINALRNRRELAALVAALHRENVRAFFALGARPDDKDASRYIAVISQGGLSMPDRDYYLKDDEKTAAIRKQYVAHVTKMFDLMAQATARKKQDADKNAAAVLAIETVLARNSMDRTAMRNPDNTYHKMTVDELTALAPDFAWREYLRDAPAPPLESLNVMQPEFIRALGKMWETTSLDDLKIYLRWRTLDSVLNVAVGAAGRTAIAAPLLPKAFDDENSDFNRRILNGVKEKPARWKTCSQLVDAELGDALGQEFVKVAFTPASRERTLQMVGEIEVEMAKVVRSAEWMSTATKDQALTKLHEVANKIGYPEKWRDYAGVKIDRADAFGNTERAGRANRQERIERIGKPVDKSEWNMTPPTVNAYYNPSENNINFPAGILQPPFFNAKAADAVNYGGIGGVIGHELTHGFDDQGRRYDGSGNLRDWWTAADGKAFDQRAECVVKEYGNFSPVSGVTLNGKLTLGENAADNGGIRLAYMALMDKLAGHPLEPVDGFTQQQLFFLGFAQIWCGQDTEESARTRARIDPHSPPQFRVNGTLQNMPEFSSAWSCKVGDAMVSPNACRVW